MINNNIPLNESYSTINQQPYNWPNIDITINNKEIEENKSLHSENNSNSSNKSDDYDYKKEYKTFFINKNNSLLNLNDYPNNQFQTIQSLFKTIKIENEEEEAKEEEKEEEGKEEEEKEQEEEERSSKRKILGRKRKGSSIKGIHNKYNLDNILRKIKSNLLDILFKFINKKINEMYKYIPNYNIKKDILMKIQKNEIVDTTADFNKEFMNKTLKIIFSVDISHKYKQYDHDHNEKLIIKLLNEKNDEKRIFFEKIFNLTFFECLEHFRGTKENPELKGIKNFEQFKEKYKSDINYIKSLNYYVNNYEEITITKKPRRKKIIKKI